MPIQNTKRWFELALPHPTDDNRRVQLGVHLEEVCEMLDTFELPNDSARIAAQATLHYLATLLKTDPTAVPVITNKLEMLDALEDQIVTATGVAHNFGMDIIRGLEEVNRSNFSKFVNGKPIFNEHGKIGKGPSYTKPNLAPFI